MYEFQFPACNMLDYVTFVAKLHWILSQFMCHQDKLHQEWNCSFTMAFIYRMLPTATSYPSNCWHFTPTDDRGRAHGPFLCARRVDCACNLFDSCKYSYMGMLR